MLKLKKVADVSIIGAGVIGSSISFELAKKGYKVKVIDKNKGIGDGTTSYSSAIIRSYYSVFDSVKFANEGYYYWKNWKDYLKISSKNSFPNFHQCGAIILDNKNSDDFIDQTLSHMESLSIPYDKLDFKETNDITQKMGWDINNCYTPKRINDPLFGEPDKNNYIIGSVILPNSGYMSDPRLATENLSTASKSLGVEFLLGREVKEIINSNGKVEGLKLDNGDIIESKIIVNAAGCHSNSVNKMAFNKIDDDTKLKLKTLRQEVAYVPSPEGIDYENNGLIAIDFDLGIYMRPELGNKVLIGGSEPPCDIPYYINDIDNNDTNFTDNWLNYVYRAALRIPQLPIPSGKNVQGIVSAYDVTDDWTPIYDKSNLDGYYMAVGTSGNQFKNAGAVGNLMANLIDLDQNKCLDQNPLHYLSYTDQYLDISSFSRLRDPHKSGTNVLG